MYFVNNYRYISAFDLRVLFDRTVKEFLYCNANVNVEQTQKSRTNDVIESWLGDVMNWLGDVCLVAVLLKVELKGAFSALDQFFCNWKPFK